MRMRRAGIALAGTALLSATACGGGSSPGSQGAGPVAPSATRVPATHPTGRAATVSASGLGTSAAPPSASARPRSGTTSPTTPARARHHSSARPHAPHSGQRETAPGSYTYDISGTSSGKHFSGKQSLVVAQVNTATQRQTFSGTDMNTAIVYRYTASAVDLLDLRLSGQLNKEFRPRPPVVQLPLPLRTGRQWSYDLVSTDRSTTIHGEFSTPSQANATVAGQSLQCINVVAHLVIHLTYHGSSFTVTDDETQCLSVSYGLALRIHDTVDAGVFGRSDSNSALRSVQPS